MNQPRCGARPNRTTSCTVSGQADDSCWGTHPTNRARNPLLFYTSQFMKMLLMGVFAFFGIQTLLWLGRGMQLKAAARLRGPGKDDSTEDGQ